MIETAHTLIQARINKDKSNLTILNNQWKEVFQSIESPSFLKLAQYIKPNIDITHHPLYDFYEMLLNSQEQSLDFSQDFLVRIAEDNYLKIDDEQSHRFMKQFYKNIDTNNILLCNLFKFYFEFNKPFFFSDFSTLELQKTHSKLTKNFILYFNQGYNEFLLNFHHTLEENGETYLYTAQRFFPAFFEYFRIISYVDTKFKENFPEMSQKELSILNYIFQSVLQNESFFNRAYFFLINLFNEKDSLNSLNELLKYSFSDISKMQLNFFEKPDKLTDKNFSIIEKHMTETHQQYSLRSFYNPFMLTYESADEEDDKGHIGVITKTQSEYSPILVIQHCYSIKKHLEKINSIFPFPSHINSSVIIGSHIARRFNEATPTACFSEVLSHKMINCHFETLKNDDTIVLAHEYFHFIDYCLMKKIFFNYQMPIPSEQMVLNSHESEMQKNVFFNFSSIFHIEFQKIFTQNTNLEYFQSPFDYLNPYPEYQNIYINLFENFIYSISSKFHIDNKVVIENKQRIEYLELLNNSIASQFSHHFIDNFTNLLKSAHFEDSHFNIIAQKIITYIDSHQSQLESFIQSKLEQSIIPAIIAKIETENLPNLFSYIQNNYHDILQDIDYRNIYEKEAFLIDLNNPSFDHKIVSNILFDISNFVYSTINLIVHYNNYSLDLFGHKNLNVSHRGYHLAEADSFLTNFVESLSLHALKQMEESLIDNKDNIKEIKNSSHPNIDLLSVSTNSHLEKTYVPIPYIFNQSVLSHLSNSDANWSMYINHPSEILARSHATLINLHKHLNSSLFFIHKEKDNFSYLTKSQDTNSLKDFSKETLQKMVSNYKSLLELIDNDNKLNSLPHPKEANQISFNPIFSNEESPFINKKELDIILSLTQKKTLKKKKTSKTKSI